MRILMTGALGFVGPYVQAAVAERHGAAPVWYLTSHRGGTRPDGTKTTALDVCDRAAVRQAIADIRPQIVIHLAGITSVKNAEAAAHETWRVNVLGTLNLVQELIEQVPGSTFVSAGTALAYGESARDGHALTEEDVLSPQNDYAVTKAAADLALGALADRGVKILRFRPFNHTGPGQGETFAIPSFVGQVARIEAGKADAVLRVGNLDVERDFLDVRDVARGYALAIERTDDLPSGTIINLASGSARSLRSLLDTILSQARTEIAVVTDPDRLRAGELPIFRGNADKARRLLDWSPQIDLSDTIRQMIAHVRAGV
ncbi:NAD-dependent epimerase/dehydratase family protein [Fulvimarina endophytica]|uniref:NAD-dependent epimerase/dehydratase family protein n=1 Tax=Fulvimarina endophytica TaxID=2293836 RepID=A0A371X356_9HYPH|nr:GDP-mannose 4,6-dehydratase [Fulvimarina endophytica]RFC63643.1 NAD-dependent epimerase/dehydratase family protein [Fulvimarina endophytica]